ncbi:MAG: hypothetical protein V1851_01180 [Patescibacteria group bacterium]
MEKVKNKKTNIFSLLGIMAVLFFAYLFMASAATGGSQLVSLGAKNTSGDVGRETLETLLKLKSLRLDGTIFEDQVFLSLKDFSVELKEQPKGRNNPFAVLGDDTDYIVSDEVSADEESN